MSEDLNTITLVRKFKITSDNADDYKRMQRVHKYTAQLVLENENEMEQVNKLDDSLIMEMKMDKWPLAVNDEFIMTISTKETPLDKMQESKWHLYYSGHKQLVTQTTKEDEYFLIISCGGLQCMLTMNKKDLQPLVDHCGMYFIGITFIDPILVASRRMANTIVPSK